MNNIREGALGVPRLGRNKVNGLVGGSDGETEVRWREEFKSSALLIEAARLPAAVCSSELCKRQI